MNHAGSAKGQSLQQGIDTRPGGIIGGNAQPSCCILGNEKLVIVRLVQPLQARKNVRTVQVSQETVGYGDFVKEYLFWPEDSKSLANQISIEVVGRDLARFSARKVKPTVLYVNPVPKPH